MVLGDGKGRERSHGPGLGMPLAGQPTAIGLRSGYESRRVFLLGAVLNNVVFSGFLPLSWLVLV
jgi:hypothetical protein